MTNQLTTHVLDAASGDPASGVQVTLTDASGAAVAQGETDVDGRLALGGERLDDGEYTLRFETGLYFAERGTASFYPFVTVTFSVEGTDDGSSRHFHVPLLLSPFAYSTYRGS